MSETLILETMVLKTGILDRTTRSRHMEDHNTEFSKAAFNAHETNHLKEIIP
jgi:hypothetical protein